MGMGRKFTLVGVLAGVVLGAMLACTPTDPHSSSADQAPATSPWEPVTSSGTPSYNRWITDRLKVPGGWLYRQAIYDNGHGIAVSICFVPEAPKPDAPR